VRLQGAIPASAPIFQALRVPWLLSAAFVILRLITPIYAFVAMPIVDAILGEEEEPALKVAPSSWYKPLYRFVCHFFVLLHIAVIMGASYVVTRSGCSPQLLLLAILNVGVTGGFAFAVAHELVHSKHGMDRKFGDVLLTLLCYKHWGVSHMAHHAQVATQEDPASARYHESVRPSKLFCMHMMVLQTDHAFA
jgi:fatty acid desaturase